LGTLPPDYVIFINQYGTGCIDNFLWIWNPESKNKYLNLLEVVKETHGYVDVAFNKAGGKAKGGLLPFGISDNGDYFCWDTYGEPSSWPVLVFDPRGGVYDSPNLKFAEFLFALFSGELILNALPRGIPSVPGSVKMVARVD
jgi:hypothetical protein